MAAPLSDEPTKEEILNAIDVLKRAGLKITVISEHQSAKTKDKTVNEDVPQLRPAASASQQYNPSEYINQDYQTINMMLGNGNNNNNDPMMNMLPYMLQQNGNGQNIDPQIIQSLMMNSMMNGINGLNTTDNNK